LKSFNFTVISNIVLGAEVSTIGEEIIVEEELVVLDIIAVREITRKIASCSSKQPIMMKNK